jgi:hypothetical protein
MDTCAVRGVSVVLAGLLSFPGLSVAGQEPSSKLKISILEGDGAINNVRLGRAKEPVVHVEEDGRPVSRAAVTFQLPSQGAGGVFPDGRTSLTILTDEKGQDAARGLRPNKTLGPFEIRVTASYKGQTASAVISQTNASPARGGGSSKTIAILVIVAGAAAGGAFAAKGGGGSKSTPPAPPAVTTIVSGTPGFGPPQ